MSSSFPLRKRAAQVVGALAAGLALTPSAHPQGPPSRAASPAAPVVQAMPPAGAGAAAVPAAPHPTVERLTLDDARQRVLANSKLLALAAANAESKGYATKAMRAQYFPQVLGNTVYFHFNDDLGTVLSTPGRTVTGPFRGRTLASIPSATVDVPVLNQDTEFSTVNAIQPLTALLKVRAGVQAARADEEIAQAQLEKGRRALVNGTEQLFWGLLAVQRIRTGAAEAVAAAEKMAAAPGAPVEVRLALAEGRQALQQVDNQLADLQEQMDLLLDLPVCTTLELAEPPVPTVPVKCADEAVALALAASPDVREAELNVVRARAGVKVAKVDYLPNVAIVGGYANQTAANYVQPNIGYVGVVGSYTFLDWGKRRNTVREAETVVGLANLKVRTTQDEVRKKALKAFRDVVQTQEAIKLAQELAGLRAEAVKKATTPAALKDPEPLLKASKKFGEAQVDLVKAELAYRTACAELMSLIGDH